MAIQSVTLTPAAINFARHLVFFRGSETATDDSVICFNYKTRQWTEIPAYEDEILFSVNAHFQDIGIVRFSSGSVDLQEQSTDFPEQTVLIETGASDLNKGGRSVVNGVRPLVNGGTQTVRVGVQDSLASAVSYSTSMSLNSRSGYANMRSEGRYVRAEVTVTGDMETALGADIDFSPQGRV